VSATSGPPKWTTNCFAAAAQQLIVERDTGAFYKNKKIPNTTKPNSNKRKSLNKKKKKPAQVARVTILQGFGNLFLLFKRFWCFPSARARSFVSAAW